MKFIIGLVLTVGATNDISSIVNSSICHLFMYLIMKIQTNEQVQQTLRCLNSTFEPHFLLIQITLGCVVGL